MLILSRRNRGGVFVCVLFVVVILVREARAVGCMVLQVKLHDYGCSLKAYRASLVSSIRLVGEMHRFIPAVAAMEGAAISELEVTTSKL